MVLRRGYFARAFVFVGTLSVALLYTVPVVRAVLLQPPPRAHALQTLVAPTLQFPAVHVPASLKTRPTVAIRPFRPLLVTQPAYRKARAHTAPIVKNQVDLTTPSSTPTPSTSIPAAPQAPVVVSSVGVEPTQFGLGAASTDVTPPATDPAATPSPPASDPAAAPPPTMSMMSTATVSSASHPAAQVRVLESTKISGSPPPPAPTVIPDPPAPLPPDPVTTTTGTTAPTTASTDPGTATISAPPVVNPPTVTTATPIPDPAVAPTTTDDSVSGSTPSGSSAAPSITGPATTPVTAVSATPDPSLTAATGSEIASGSTDGASSARAPPAPWIVTTADSSTQISIVLRGTDLVITVHGVSESRPVDSVSGVTVTGAQSTNVSIDLSGGPITVGVAVDGAGVTSLAIGAGPGSDYTYDGSGVSVTGGGIASISLPNVTAISAGGSSDTLHGPAPTPRGRSPGAGSGVVDGLAFSGFENLAGAANNADTFDVAPGGSVSGVIDGGAGGFDTLQVAGDSLVSRRADAQSGAVIVDGATTITYAGLEPVRSLGRVRDDQRHRPRRKHRAPGQGLPQGLAVLRRLVFDRGLPDRGHCIQVQNYAGPLGVGPEIAELSYFVIAGTTSVTIDGGLGTDTVEFTGDYLVPGSSLTVDAEHIKVDSGVTSTSAAPPATTSPSTRSTRTTGSALLGITTTIPVLGVDPLVDIDNATLNGNTINLTAFAGTLSTTVNGASQDLTGGNLIVGSVAGFDNSSGTFTVAGGTGTCAYTGRDTTAEQAHRHHGLHRHAGRLRRRHVADQRDR